MYWSEQHFITKALFDKLPFGEILSHTWFYSYVDYTLNELLGAANNTLLYWCLSNITQFDSTPVTELSLFYDDTFLWHYSVPLYWEEIWSQINSGRRVRFLSRFCLSQTKVEVEFNEIWLQATEGNNFQFIYTDSKSYQYKFATLEWDTTINNIGLPLVNPWYYTLPITQPNTQGQEAKYQACLEQIQALPNNIQIQDTYWDSVNSSTRASTPDHSTNTNYWTPTNFQFASPTAASTNSADSHSCLCGIDICYCNNRHPRAPPTPTGIHLWRPCILSRPINCMHYNQQVQTGTLTTFSTSRPPEIMLYPRITPVCTF